MGLGDGAVVETEGTSIGAITEPIAMPKIGRREVRGGEGKTR